MEMPSSLASTTPTTGTSTGTSTGTRTGTLPGLFVVTGSLITALSGFVATVELLGIGRAVGALHRLLGLLFLRTLAFLGLPALISLFLPAFIRFAMDITIPIRKDVVVTLFHRAGFGTLAGSGRRLRRTCLVTLVAIDVLLRSFAAT